MLILARRIGERIVINGVTFIEVKALRYHNGKACGVELAIDAPKGVLVDREEIHLKRGSEQ